MKIIKRDGREVEFSAEKITSAIQRAVNECGEDERKPNAFDISMVCDVVSYACQHLLHTPTVEEVQNLVEDTLLKYGWSDVAKRYIKYRYAHELLRKSNTTDKAVLSLVEYQNEEVKQENSNKNPAIIPTQRDYIAGEVSKDLSRRYLLPSDIVRAHDEGILHFHDMDYFLQHISNCCLVNLEDMLQNGTCISGTMIEKPHMFSTACNIATQIIAQVASCQYGGQTISLAHLAPFVEETRKNLRERYSHFECALSSGETFEEFIEQMVHEDVVRGVQTIQYQIITLMTTNGQSPFVSIYMDINEVAEGPLRKDLALIIEEVLVQRIQGVKNEVGAYVTPAFPKLLYVLDENNVTEGSEYYYLTELAAVCTARRMVPDYISAKLMRQIKNGDVFGCMGCRSFLSQYITPEGDHKYYGRFNQGVVTINLVDVALSSGKDMEKFWQLLDERLELCHKALRYRHERLRGTPSDVAPILWQHGALARLKKGEAIDRFLYNGYSTISLGYAGLYECVKYMLGVSHTSPDGEPFAIRIMEEMNRKCDLWRDTERIGYSLYGTPLESTTYRFAKCLQNRFGVVEGVTDKNYITNSFHVVVTEPIDAFTKLKFESEFQALSTGGTISYVEVPNLQQNIPAVLTLIRYIYDNIMYAELNTKCDYCQVCGFDGEIEIRRNSEGRWYWECPNCHNTDQNKMNVVRRTCGYLGTNYWNQGRSQEIAERVLHL